jgi:hypothetical protein
MRKAIVNARRQMWLNEEAGRDVSPSSRDDPDATLVMPVQETRLPPTIAASVGTHRQRDLEQTIKTPPPKQFIPAGTPIKTATLTRGRKVWITVAAAIVIMAVVWGLLAWARTRPKKPQPDWSQSKGATTVSFALSLSKQRRGEEPHWYRTRADSSGELPDGIETKHTV